VSQALNKNLKSSLLTLNNKHYNTSAILTYQIKIQESNKYNYINPPKESILETGYNNPTAKQDLCQQTKICQTSKCQNQETDPVRRIQKPKKPAQSTPRLPIMDKSLNMNHQT